MTVLTNLQHALFASLCLGPCTYAAAEPLSTYVAPVRFSQLSAGSGHTLGLSTTGTVWAWGDNMKKQLGVAGPTSVDHPVPVLGALAGKKVRSVLAAGEHSLALTDDGQVYAWGNTTVTPIFGFDPDIPLTPTRVEGVLRGLKVIAIGAAEYANYAITEDGELYEWRRDTVDSDGNSLATPVAILPGHRVVKVVGGGDISFAIDDTGALWGWGWGVGPNGELNQPGVRAQPARVAALAGKVITQLAVGGEHVLAATAQGEVFAWGQNYWGQLGTGQAGEGHDSALPIALSRSLFKGKVIKLGADRNVSYAITDCDRLYAWGWNYSNQLPVAKPTSGETTNVPTLAPYALFRGVTTVDGGYSHGVALAADGSVLAWGSNGAGELGLGVTTTLPRVFSPTRAQPVSQPLTQLPQPLVSRLRITYPTVSGDTLKQQPTFYGTGTPGAALLVRVSASSSGKRGQTLCTTTVNRGGYWNCTPATALEPGTAYAIRAVVRVHGRPVRSSNAFFTTSTY